MTTTVEWRPAPGFPGYEVSRDGQVRRSAPGRRTFVGRLLRTVVSGPGYVMCNPVRDGRNVSTYVHRLVAAAFLGPCPDGHEVNHKDGDKTNPHADNLEYVTHRGNALHAVRTGLIRSGADSPHAKLTADEVAALRADREAGLSFSHLARKYGISIGHAHGIVHHKYHKVEDAA